MLWKKATIKSLFFWKPREPSKKKTEGIWKFVEAQPVIESTEKRLETIPRQTYKN
jgi:hypothetical protein